jgi:hypothetical protein
VFGLVLVALAAVVVAELIAILRRVSLRDWLTEIRLGHSGGPWWAVEILAGRPDRLSAGSLAHEGLAWADGNGIWLVARARDPGVARIYHRRGFRPIDSRRPLLLHRPPMRCRRLGDEA